MTRKYILYCWDGDGNCWDTGMRRVQCYFDTRSDALTAGELIERDHFRVFGIDEGKYV